MKYPNAFKGVNKVYIAEILTIVILLLVGIAGVLVYLPAYQEENSILLSIVGGLFLAASVGLLFTYVIKFAGLYKAGRDEYILKVAYYVVLISFLLILTSFILSFFKETVFASKIVDLVVSFLDIVITIIILFGLISLADKSNQKLMSKKGKRLVVLIIFTFVVSYTFTLLSKFLPLTNKNGLLMGFSIAALVLEIIAYILYLIYLHKSVQMLGQLK